MIHINQAGSEDIADWKQADEFAVFFNGQMPQKQPQKHFFQKQAKKKIDVIQRIWNVFGIVTFLHSF